MTTSLPVGYYLDLVTEDCIKKYAVIGYLIVERTESEKKNRTILSKPMPVFDYIKLQENERLISVMPAQYNTFHVTGLVPIEGRLQMYPKSGEEMSLGYECLGVNHPEWLLKLKDKVRNVLVNDFGMEDMGGQ